MLKSTFNNIEISGLAVAVPTKWNPVENFVDLPDEENIQKFKKRTGVCGRFEAAENQVTSDFCFVAAKRVMEHTKVSPDDIDILIFVSQSPDYRSPATACVLHHRLGLNEKCLAFDVNQGCAGFLYGLQCACSILQSSNAKTALLLCGEICGKYHRHYVDMGWMDSSDNDAKLFGDAGTAILLKKTKATDQVADTHIALRADGNGFKTIIKPWGGYRHMNGVDMIQMDSLNVFNFGMEKPAQLIKELMEEIGTDPKMYDCIVLHQANLFLMKQVAKRAGFEKSQNLVSIDQFANTSSASIPTALVKYYGDEDEGRIRAMLCAFGVGLSWGAASLVIDKKNILPLIRTDEFFDDGFSDFNMSVAMK